MNAPSTVDTATVTGKGETSIEIPFDQLHDSPDNPRKTYTNIEQLTADIKARGRILQPLRVRRRMVNANGVWVQDGFEIIFGHRRKRAGLAAGLAGAPCLVDDVSDAEARRMQVSENLSREDVHPIEEAEGYLALIEKDGMTAEQIAEQYGKSLSHIYGRLKLLQACPTVREACVRGEILPTVALLIARLRTEKLQEKALGYIKGKYLDLKDGGKSSFRSIQSLLNEHFALDLDKAFFDPADATLLPDAGTCTDCPRRSGNAPEFEDIAQAEKASSWSNQKLGPNVCTDPDCHALKRTAHLKREAEALQAEGKTVVTGNAARNAVGADGKVKGAYVALADIRKALKAADGQRPDVVLLQDPRTGDVVEAVHRKAAQAAGVPVADKASKAEDQAKEAEKQARAKEKADRLTAERLALFMAVRERMADQPLQETDARAVARAALGGVDYGDGQRLAELWNCNDRFELEKRIRTMSLPEATKLARDCALISNVHVNPYCAHNPEPAAALTAVAKALGIEPEAGTKKKAEPKAKTPKAKPGAAPMYRDAATGQTWTGRGLKPKWVQAALDSGKTLDELRTTGAA